jgi:enoyl-CoA hydratase/carnithine racemase
MSVSTSESGLESLAMPETISAEVVAGCLRLRLMRARKKNALTGEMYLALSEALLAASADETIRVVVISGEGADFCAGNDIMDFAQKAMSGGGADSAETSPALVFLKTLCYFDKPLVAAVEGLAVGIGTTLLLHCDLVVAGESARFSVPFLKLGLTPEGGSSRLLSPLMGHRKAFEWLAFGEAKDAAWAQTCGLINKVTADGEALPVAMDCAERLAHLSPSALKHTKGLMRDPESLWSVIRQEAHIFYEQLRSPEAVAAFQAFMNR